MTRKNILLYFAIFLALTGIILLAFCNELVSEMASATPEEKANIQKEWKYPAVRVAGNLFGWFEKTNLSPEQAVRKLQWQTASLSLIGIVFFILSIILFITWWIQRKKLPREGISQT